MISPPAPFVLRLVEGLREDFLAICRLEEKREENGFLKRSIGNLRTLESITEKGCRQISRDLYYSDC